MGGPRKSVDTAALLREAHLLRKEARRRMSRLHKLSGKPEALERELSAIEDYLAKALAVTKRAQGLKEKR